MSLFVGKYCIRKYCPLSWLLLRGVLGVVRKSGWSPIFVFYYIFDLSFWSPFFGGGGGEGTFRAPFLLPPSCVYLSPVWLRLLRVIVMNWGSKFIWEILPAKIHFKWLRHRGKEETSCLWFCGGVFSRVKVNRYH